MERKELCADCNLIGECEVESSVTALKENSTVPEHLKEEIVDELKVLAKDSRNCPRISSPKFTTDREAKTKDSGQSASLLCNNN